MSRKNISILVIISVVALGIIITTTRISQPEKLDIRNEAASTNTASLGFKNSSQKATINQPFTTTIKVNPGNLNSIIGVDIVLNFDKTKLRLENVSLVNGHSLQTLLPITSAKKFDINSVKNNANSTGKVVFGAAAFNLVSQQKTPPQTTAFDMVNLTFRPLTQGSTTLTFLNSDSGIDSNIIALSAKSDVLGSASSATISISTPTSSTITPTNTKVPTPTNTPKPTNTKSPTPTKTPIPTQIPTSNPQVTNTSIPTPTNVTTSITTVPISTNPNNCPRKSEGDANCDGTINYIDFVCWRGEIQGNKPNNCVSADFVGTNNTVDSRDFVRWFVSFKKEQGL